MWLDLVSWQGILGRVTLILCLDGRVWGRDFKSTIINPPNLFGFKGFLDGFEINTPIFCYFLSL